MRLIRLPDGARTVRVGATGRVYLDEVEVGVVARLGRGVYGAYDASGEIVPAAPRPSTLTAAAQLVVDRAGSRRATPRPCAARVALSHAEILDLLDRLPADHPLVPRLQYARDTTRSETPDG